MLSRGDFDFKGYITYLTSLYQWMTGQYLADITIGQKLLRVKKYKKL